MKRFTYIDLDFKYKWKEDSYTSLTLQGEFLGNKRTLSSGTIISSGGAYLFVDYQFQKIYTIGTRLDYASSPYSSSNQSKGISLFLGFYPVEETTGFRVQFQHVVASDIATGSTGINSIAFQVILSLGPHKAHPF